MSSHYISFTFFSCEIGVASYNGHKDHEITCFATSTINIIMFINFDIWMFRGGVDTFALVINYLDKPRHATIGLFEVHETSGGAMVL